MFKLKFKDKKILKYLCTNGKEIKIQDNLSNINEILGFRGIIEVIICSSLEDMSTLMGRKIPAWVIGTNISGKILLLDYRLWKDRMGDTPLQIIVHEYVHVVINQQTHYKCPMWLNEGLALYFAEQINDMSLPSILESDSIYKMNYGDEYFYEVCGKFIEYLIRNYGIEMIRSKLNNKTCFYNDDFLGIKNINKLFNIFITSQM